MMFDYCINLSSRLIFAGLITFVLYLNASFEYPPLFYLTNLLILNISIILLLSKPEQYYSLDKIFYLFCFFFYGFVPLSDASGNIWYWGGSAFDPMNFIVTNIYILLGILSYWIGGFVAGFFSFKLKLNSFRYICSRRPTLFIIFFSLFIFILISYFYDFNLYYIFLRGFTEDILGVGDYVQAEQTYLTFFNTFIRPLPLYIFFLYFFIVHNRNKFAAIVLFLIGILSLFPTSVARFQVATLYFTLLMVCLPGIFGAQYRLQLSFLGGLLFAFPFLDKFRNFGANDISLAIDFSFIQAGHFDAYQTFSRAVSHEFITFGYQLFGVLFFWIPRVLWVDKPIGSGAELAKLEGLDFENISMPFFGEGYVNFGLLGVILFCFILGVSVKIIDEYYWKLRRHGVRSVYRLFYYLMFGLFFFVLRGDLLSSVAYAFGMLSSFLLLSFFFVRFLCAKA